MPLYILRCPIGPIPGVALLGHRWLYYPCDSDCQIALPGQKLLGWVRSASLSHPVGEWEGWAPQRVRVAGPYTSQVRGKRRTTTRMWPCPLWHIQDRVTAWCITGPRSCFPRERMSVMWWRGGPGVRPLHWANLPSCIFPSTPYPKSPCRAVGRIQKTVIHKMQQHRWS